MGTTLIPLNSSGAMLLTSEKTPKRHQKIRTQASFLAADRVQISVFEQTRKEFLNHVLPLLSSKPLPPGKSVERPPIGSAEYLECLLCSRRFALRLQHNAPMSGCKGHSATIGAFDCRGTVHDLMLHASVAFG